MNGERILERIRKSVGERVWEKWFSTFELLRVERGTVVFGVGNLFIKDWLHKRYGKEIKKALKEEFGKDLDFDIVYVQSERREYVKPEKPRISHPDMNPMYTFENFVVGPANETAYKFSLKVSSEPGRFSPLFVYGGVGLGKTHLAQAIGNAVYASKPELKIVYTSSERFMNDMIRSIRDGTMEAFRNRYRKVDVLIVDDVQFLMGKNGVQFELFNTFNELANAGKQMVFCSDRSPDELQDFQERLISRFKMGIVVRLDTPDIKTRIEIAKMITKMEGGDLDEELIEFLARNVDGSLRELRGAIIKLIAYQEIEGEKLSVYSAAGLLENFLKPVSDVDPLEKLMGVLSIVFDVAPSDIRGKSRGVSSKLAREIGIYFAKKYMKMSSESISRAFNRSESVVSRIVRRLEKDAKESPIIEGYLQKILAHFSPAVGRM